MFFFFKQKTAYEIKECDWSSDVCSSDLSWHKVSLRRVDPGPQEIIAGDSLPIRVAAHLDGLDTRDVVVECLIGTETVNGEFQRHQRLLLEPAGARVKGELVFALDLQPDLSGLMYYKLRMYPHHELLGHPFETGCMTWL